MDERRKLKRRHLIYYLRVIDRETDKFIGFLADISSEGLMIVTEKPIPLKKVFKLKILVRKDKLEEKYLNFEAESRWCNNDVNPNFYDTGFKLLNIGPHDLLSIQNIIKELGFHD